jgi:thiol-disulfide isomerase/thioredoxin
MGVGVYFYMPQVREGFESGKRVLLVHAKWCGHCRKLLEKGGVWESVKKELPGVRFEEVEESQATEAIASLGVVSFPDIRIVDTTGASVAKYEGTRDARSIKQFVLANITPDS